MDRVRRTETVHSGRPRNAYDEGHAPRSNTKRQRRRPTSHRRPSTALPIDRAGSNRLVTRLANTLATTLLFDFNQETTNTGGGTSSHVVQNSTEYAGSTPDSTRERERKPTPHNPPGTPACRGIDTIRTRYAAHHAAAPTIPISGGRHTRSVPRSPRQTANPPKHGTQDGGGESRVGHTTGKMERGRGIGGGIGNQETRRNKRRKRVDAEDRSKAYDHRSRCPIAEEKGKGLDGPREEMLTLLLRRRAATPALLSHTALGVGERTRDLMLVVVVVVVSSAGSR
ncbi:hypothetical protein DFH09DRAFT_1088093 [Mycena vulgaris]|nr:hypothetical protein DFH09DRAFT_1088093 [Mycena vulgaris]